MTRWEDLPDPQQRAWYGFLRTHANIVRVLDAELQERCGLSLGEYHVLVTLHYGPPEGLRMGQLAEAVVLSPSGVTRVVTRLEQAGFVERHAENQRIVRAVLSPKGRDVLEQAAPVHLAGVQRCFLDPVGSDADRLADLWGRLDP